jgi:hypothetical protein
MKLTAKIIAISGIILGCQNSENEIRLETELLVIANYLVEDTSITNEEKCESYMKFRSKFDTLIRLNEYRSKNEYVEGKDEKPSLNKINCATNFLHFTHTFGYQNCRQKYMDTDDSIVQDYEGKLMSKAVNIWNYR